MSDVEKQIKERLSKPETSTDFAGAQALIGAHLGELTAARGGFSLHIQFIGDGGGPGDPVEREE
jgi:hypothetical protein